MFYKKKVEEENHLIEFRLNESDLESIYSSFDTLTDAKKWARKMEGKLDRGDTSDYSEASKVTLGDLFSRYISEDKHKKKKQWKNEEYRKDQLLERMRSLLLIY